MNAPSILPLVLDGVSFEAGGTRLIKDLSCQACMLASRLRATPLRASVLRPQPIARGSLLLASPPRQSVGFRRLHPPRGPQLL